MIGFIFIGIPLICIVILIAMACSGGSENSKRNNTYVFIHDEDGEIVDSFVDKTGMYQDCIDDDYMDEVGEDF